MRQIQQLAQVLAQVLVQKRLDRGREAQDALERGVEAALGLSLDDLHQLGRPTLLAMCEPGEVLYGDTAASAADLLAEDASAAGRQRALWLYEHAIAHGLAVPFDVHDRMDAIQASLTS
ncbi:MAG: hypothetical protein AAGK21_09975 [Bacteroidota bacterium]